MSMLLYQNIDTDKYDSDNSSDSGESSSESGEWLNHIEFDLSSCQQLKSLIFHGNGIWIKGT
ncbi:hypothetical protein DPMN_097046 [Dreissena polymorpha]|uniref:Uncharacterized protein n=1 Tax=Dreissena polymorpha TaxID=45954 RepID=A0A9D4R523_DREPO|nr:hypothetical protein DPMN_097046 [Dreissena polymorpha]